MTTPLSTPKGRRISLVWATGGLLTLVWALLEWLAPSVIPPPAVISAGTGLAMGLAMFADVKAADAGFDPFDPGDV